jgi:putative 4-mercaptohistidine N1-methyltranferase
MPTNFYETDRALSEYLLFHYGMTPQLVPPGLSDSTILNFPVRCVADCLEPGRLPDNARALDLGCAVGRASFELARTCHEVLGIDFSKHFIAIASHLKRKGSLQFDFVEEGVLTRRGRAVVPSDIDRKRVRFETGDATVLPSRLGAFDVILMANLIDRLRNPAQCLKQLPKLIRPGGQLIITSPYTWLPEYTPRKNWLGGFSRAGKRVETFQTLRRLLSPDFSLLKRRDLPFLIREHARKFQLGIAEASVWLRK